MSQKKMEEKAIQHNRMKLRNSANSQTNQQEKTSAAQRNSAYTRNEGDKSKSISPSVKKDASRDYSSARKTKT